MSSTVSRCRHKSYIDFLLQINKLQFFCHCKCKNKFWSSGERHKQNTKQKPSFLTFPNVHLCGMFATVPSRREAMLLVSCHCPGHLLQVTESPIVRWPQLSIFCRHQWKHLTLAWQESSLTGIKHLTQSVHPVNPSPLLFLYRQGKDYQLTPVLIVQN